MKILLCFTGDCLHLSGLDILDGTPVLDIKPYILQYDAPPMVASHFTDPTRVTSCKRLDEGLDSFNQDDRIQGGESTDEISEGETRPKGNEDVGALHREKCSHELSNDESKCMCDENVKNEKPRLKHSHDKSESNDEILKSQNKIKGMPADEKENVQVVTYETPAMSQSTDKAGMDMEPSDFVRHTNLYSEQNEKDEKEREMLDAHGDIEESEEGRDAEKVRNEKEIRTKEVVHFPGDTKESEECQDKSTVKEMSEGKGKESQHEEGDERSGGNRTNVQIASWVSEPPTASLQVIFNPIAVQQVEAFSCQAQDEKYRYVSVCKTRVILFLLCQSVIHFCFTLLQRLPLLRSCLSLQCFRYVFSIIS